MAERKVLQFKISLLETNPPIWRRILIPQEYTFWDLHVAIQDSMGWLDYHLHEFVVGSERETIKIGIPDEGADESNTLIPGWEAKVREYFVEIGDNADYTYDFGDNWGHEILFEGVLLREPGEKYPKCIGGMRNCPPEDCHGTYGYERLLEILADPSHQEFDEMKKWLQGHAKNYWPFNSENFDAASVAFDDPEIRWKKTFS